MDVGGEMGVQTPVEGFARRLMDVGDETGVQTPVEGLTAVVLVTLDCALQMAVADGVLPQDEMETVKQLAYIFADRKLRGGLDRFSLTREEIAAIHSYTQQSQLYIVLNARLRSADRILLAPLLAYLKLLLTALYKLPLSSVTVWRGIKLSLRTLGGYRDGSPVIWWGLSSTTANVGMLTDDEFLGTSGPRTLFTMETSSVVSIQLYSAMDEEAEYVALPGTRYDTVSVLEQAGDLNIVHLKDSTSPPLIDFVHPQIASRLRLNMGPLSSISDAVSRPNPRKSEPRCFLLHARSGYILENHRPSWRVGRFLQLHMLPDMQDGHVADCDVRSLSRGRFCWKLEVHAKGPDGRPSQACIRSDVCPQNYVAGDSFEHLQSGLDARRRGNLESQWVPQFMDNQTVAFQCRQNDLYLAAEERNGVMTLSFRNVPDAWILLPAAGAFTPRAARAITAATVMGSAAAGTLVVGGAAAVVAGVSAAYASSAGASAAVAVPIVMKSAVVAVTNAAAAVTLTAGTGAMMHVSVSPMDDRLWVDKT